MSELVNASPDDLRRLRREIAQMQTAVTTATGRARSTLNSIAWNDRKRREFEQQLTALTGGINRAAGQADELIKSLDSTIAQLDQYLRR
jgi:hypothetical protein